MHARQHDLFVLRADYRDVLAGQRIRQRHLLQKRIHVVVAKRILRELLEIVEARLGVRELRPRVVAVAALDNDANRLRRVPFHRLRVNELQHRSK